MENRVPQSIEGLGVGNRSRADEMSTVSTFSGKAGIRTHWIDIARSITSVCCLLPLVEDDAPGICFVAHAAVGAIAD